MAPAQVDVAQATQVADGHVAGLAHPVLADPEPGRRPVEQRARRVLVERYVGRLVVAREVSAAAPLDDGSP
jgi:hypothetical protein